MPKKRKQLVHLAHLNPELLGVYFGLNRGEIKGDSTTRGAVAMNRYLLVLVVLLFACTGDGDVESQTRVVQKISSQGDYMINSSSGSLGGDLCRDEPIRAFIHAISTIPWLFASRRRGV